MKIEIKDQEIEVSCEEIYEVFEDATYERTGFDSFYIGTVETLERTIKVNMANAEPIMNQLTEKEKKDEINYILDQVSNEFNINQNQIVLC